MQTKTYEKNSEISPLSIAPLFSKRLNTAYQFEGKPSDASNMAADATPYQKTIFMPFDEASYLGANLDPIHFTEPQYQASKSADLRNINKVERLLFLSVITCIENIYGENKKMSDFMQYIHQALSDRACQLKSEKTYCTFFDDGLNDKDRYVFGMNWLRASSLFNQDKVINKYLLLRDDAVGWFELHSKLNIANQKKVDILLEAAKELPLKATTNKVVNFLSNIWKDLLADDHFTLMHRPINKRQKRILEGDWIEHISSEKKSFCPKTSLLVKMRQATLEEQSLMSQHLQQNAHA